MHTHVQVYCDLDRLSAMDDTVTCWQLSKTKQLKHVISFQLLPADLTSSISQYD